MHINMTKGDYIFYEWNENSFDGVQAKKNELELSGYALKEIDDDYLNEYFIYENADKDTKMITFCRC